MLIAIIDARKYGKQTKYYVLRSEAINDDFLPEPSLNWREVQKKDFHSESTSVYFERSNNGTERL